MRRTVLTFLGAALLAAGAPGTASAEVCENPEGLEVIQIGGGSSTINTPSFLVGYEVESKAFMLDLSPASETSTADLTVSMSWTVRANDYDMAVSSSLEGVATEDYQPFDPPIETAKVRAAHCDTIYVEAIDFLAPVFVDTLNLSFTVSNLAH